MRSLLLTLLTLPAILLNATHNRAGEIVYKQTSDRTVEATIVTYTQSSSLAADRDSLEICWGDNTCELLIRVNGNEIENDYKVNRYVGSHTYENHGNYTISMTDPNRNANILNVGTSNSDLVQFHIQSSLIVAPMNATTTNQSPQLLEAPIDIGYIRQPFMHTPNAMDADGDSIAYELVTPLSAFGEPVPDFKMVDEIGSSADNTYSFDETTGLFVWNSPQLVGQYNIAYKIKSFRSGVLQDEMIRDMQILVLPEENLPPIIESDDLPLEIEVTAGTSVDWSFTFSDPEDGMDNLPTVTATSELIGLGASLNVLDNTGEFQWTVSEEAIRRIPYQLVFKVTDSKGLSTFKVVKVKVTSFSVSTTNTFKEAGYELYPNPVKDQFYIKLPTSLINQSATITIYNASGILVYRKTYLQIEAITTLFANNLAKGNYLINVQVEEMPTAASILIKI